MAGRVRQEVDLGSETKPARSGLPVACLREILDRRVRSMRLY